MLKNNLTILLFLILTAGALQLKAEKYTVSSASDISNLPTLNPGDIVVMADGTWIDQDIVFKGTGTADKPIRLRAQTPGQVVLTGTSKLDICGDYLIVESIKFLNGTVSGNLIEFRHNSIVSNHCRLTNVTIKDFNPADKTIDSKWISLFGMYNRVDHCSISGKTNSGTTLVVWMDETPDNHLIDHNYFGQRPELGENGGETIRIGTSSWVEYSSNTIVEYNVFEETDGEVEIISNKSVGNIYRYNTFYHCNGTLTLRHGSYCKVYGNFFIGDPDKNSGGVRIIGEGHEVYNNYFETLYGTSYRAAISMVNGIPDSPVSGYYQVKNAKVGFNTIVDCKQPFALGVGKDDEKTLPPIESVIANNLVVGKSDYNVIVDYDDVSGITFEGNIAEADDLGVDLDEGFLLTTVDLEKGTDIYRPAEICAAIDAATSSFSNIDDDIDGQSRSSSNRDVGCDEVSTDPFTNFILSSDEVGADYTETTYPSISSSVIPDDLKIYNMADHVIIDFGDSTSRHLNVYRLNGSMVSSINCSIDQINLNKTGLNQLVLVQVQEEGLLYSFKLVL